MILVVASKQSVIDSFPHFYSVFFFSNYVAGDLKCWMEMYMAGRNL